MGDADGLVVIPRRDAADLLDAFHKNLAMEQKEIAGMKNGSYTEEHHKNIFTGQFLDKGGSLE